MARGRNINTFGQFLSPFTVDGAQPPAGGGQPVMHRMQGVPTMPGYRDRPGKWNMWVPALLAATLEWLRQLAGRVT